MGALQRVFNHQSTFLRSKKQKIVTEDTKKRPSRRNKPGLGGDLGFSFSEGLVDLRRSHQRDLVLLAPWTLPW